uniref:Alpha-ketoglutarate-dependent dioxygenase alkB-like protein 2 n=1 Tax=Noccaea caerulescens TaxID=107243 RepID=A0A1J3II18_NOCCA
MEKSTPVRKPHTSTADLLTWPENQPFESPAAAASRSAARSHQPSDGISKVVFGGQVTDEEVESLNKRKPCSNYKMKEITGSGIFSVYEENDDAEQGSAAINGKTRTYQQPAAAIVSHISFGEEEIVTPKKPATVSEVAKQRELGGTLQSQSDAKLNKQFSDSKFKELSGHNIFAPPPEIKLRPTVRALAYKDNFDLGESDTKPDGELKTAKKIPDRKFIDLSGNNVFKGDGTPPSSATAEKLLSTAKLKEISGNDIFADAKAQSRDYFGGVRKPPGGESSIALV